MASHSFQCEAGLEQQLCWPPPTNQDGKALQFVSTGLQDDPKIRTLAAVQQDLEELKEAPEELKKDKEFMIWVMKANAMALEHAGEEMKGDRELCMAAVAQDWLALEHATNEIKKDLAILRAAFQSMKLNITEEEMTDSPSC